MASINKHIILIKIAIVLFMPYIFQFILLPLIFPDIRGDRIGYAANVFNLIFPILGMAFLTDKLFHWSLGAFAYSFLAMLYHSPGIYGIGMLGISFVSNSAPNYDRTSEGFAIVIIVILNFLYQFAVWACFKIFKMVRAYLKKKKSEA